MELSLIKFRLDYQQKADRLIFPGHNESTTLNRELALNPFLAAPTNVKYLTIL